MTPLDFLRESDLRAMQADYEAIATDYLAAGLDRMADPWLMRAAQCRVEIARRARR